MSMSTSARRTGLLGIAILILLAACDRRAGSLDQRIDKGSEAIASEVQDGHTNSKELTRPRIAKGVSHAPSDASGPRPHVQRSAMVSLPTRDDWVGTYDIEGSIQVSKGGFSRNFPTPSEFQATFSNAPPTLMFYGRGKADGHEFGMGFMLGLSSPRGAQIKRLSIISPMRDGTLTYGFPLADQLPWLQAADGSKHRVLTRDGVYQVSILRASRTVWTIGIDPRGEPHDWFTRGEFRLEVDTPVPPWKSINILFDSENGNATTTAELRLRRR